KLLREAISSLPKENFHAILLSDKEDTGIVPPYLRKVTFILPEWQLERISRQENCEGVVTVLYQSVFSLSSPYPPAVLAEGLQDPGNLGTLLRTMEWMGWNCLWLSEGSVDPFHPRAVRASMGSLFRVYVQQAKDWDRLLQAYEGRCIVASPEGVSPQAVQWEKYDALYIGSESQGVRYAPLHWPRVQIPPAPSARAESLNVAIATAILLYLQREFRAGRIRI
ncbi:MAG: RNA methyltransferase, partial [Bacteroidia bacterium]|nr:RNA methyltransferase [Bacteroidia bacterium]